MPKGRPSKFDELTESDLKHIEFCYKKGFTDKEVAEMIGVVEDTITNWKKAHPNFFVSLKDWKLEADEKIEKALYNRAVGYEKADKHYPADATSMIFWLKNRKPKEWRDKQETELSGELTNNIKVTFEDS